MPRTDKHFSGRYPRRTYISLIGLGGCFRIFVKPDTFFYKNEKIVLIKKFGTFESFVKEKLEDERKSQNPKISSQKFQM